MVRHELDTHPCSATHPWCLPLPPLKPPRALGPDRTGPWSHDMFEEMFENSEVDGGILMMSVLN